MTNQKQNATDGAQAIQAGRDVTINQGLTFSQMKEIYDEIAKQSKIHASTALKEYESRFEDLAQSVFDRFARDTSTRPEAFSEPDFQGALLDAQKAYARSGDVGLRDVLRHSPSGLPFDVKIA